MKFFTNTLLTLALLSRTLLPVMGQDKVNGQCKIMLTLDPDVASFTPPSNEESEVLIASAVAFLTTALDNALPGFNSFTMTYLGYEETGGVADLTMGSVLIFDDIAPSLTNIVAAMSAAAIADIETVVAFVKDACEGCSFDFVKTATFDCEEATPAPSVSRAPSPAPAAPVNPSPSPDDPVDEGCFSSESTVQVAGKGEVTMTDLQVGEQVLTKDGIFEPVYAFGHKDAEGSAHFFQIHTEEARAPLEVTGEHLVFVFNKANPVRADSIEVGEHLQGQAGGLKVTRIESVARDGLYTPLTPSGTVVVDGISASSYISFQEDTHEFVKLGGVDTPISHHVFVHTMLAPFRAICMNLPTSMTGSVCDSYNAKGLPEIVAFGMDIIAWGKTQTLLVQVVVLSFFMVVCGAGQFILAAMFAYALSKKNTASKIKSA